MIDKRRRRYAIAGCWIIWALDHRIAAAVGDEAIPIAVVAGSVNVIESNQARGGKGVARWRTITIDGHARLPDVGASDLGDDDAALHGYSACRRGTIGAPRIRAFSISWSLILSRSSWM